RAEWDTADVIVVGCCGGQDVAAVAVGIDTRDTAAHQAGWVGAGDHEAEVDVPRVVGGDGRINEYSGVVGARISLVVGDAIKGQLTGYRCSLAIRVVAVVHRSAIARIIQPAGRGKRWTKGRQPVVRRQRVVGGLSP